MRSAIGDGPSPRFWMLCLADWRRAAGFGIYLHWPFCAAKCPYCDFNSHVSNQIDHERWRDAFVSEIKRAAERNPDQIVKTIYFGGGTPSLMPAATVSAIIDAISGHFRMANDPEITLEANPGSVETDRFRAYHSAGVNRVSLGVQAFNDQDLRKLGRVHSADEAKQALTTAFETFDRVSFDLIYGRQDQDLADWCAELRYALSLNTCHLSLYQLSVEPGTVFARRAAAGMLDGLPNEDLSADFFEATIEHCEAAGLENYEISNFARPDSQSRHNLTYWKGGDYIGVGPGAHGRESRGPDRLATLQPRLPDAWLVAVSEGKALKSNKISRGDQRLEYLLMGLRLREGVALRPFQDLGGQITGQGWDKMRSMGLILVENDHIRASDQGRQLLNAVLSELEI